MLNCAMWLGLRQSGKQGSTSGQAMSMAPAQMICPTISMAQMGPLSTTTWAQRDTVPESPFSSTASQLGGNTPVLEPPLQPSELEPRYVASHSGMCSKTGEEIGITIPFVPSICLPVILLVG